MGCYDNKVIIIPRLVKLAADGVRFRNHYNSGSICMASRAATDYREWVNDSVKSNVGRKAEK